MNAIGPGWIKLRRRLFAGQTRAEAQAFRAKHRLMIMLRVINLHSTHPGEKCRHILRRQILCMYCTHLLADMHYIHNALV